MTEDLRREVLRIVGRGLEPEAPASAAPTPETGDARALSAEASTELTASKPPPPVQEMQGTARPAQDESMTCEDGSHDRDGLAPGEKVDAAMQHGSEKTTDRQLIVRRSHGGALPE
jgi:hypothetical protein